MPAKKLSQPQSLNQQLCTLKELALSVQALKRSTDEFCKALGVPELNDDQLDVVVDYVMDIDPRDLTKNDMWQVLSDIANKNGVR